METGNVSDVIFTLREINNPEWGISIVGPDGTPAFGGKVTVPERILLNATEVTEREKNFLIFYKPLFNSAACAGCHNPQDKIRGMLIIKHSLEGMNKEIEGTAKRVIFFALLLGVISEAFLIFIIKRFVLNPLGILKRGAENILSGDFDTRIEIDTKDEFSVVGDVFNDMVKRISNFQSHLEAEIKQKTKELSTIAELSTEVFKGDLMLREIIEQFLMAITQKMGYRYAVICLVDKESGLLTQEFKKGIKNGLCATEIALASNHPFAVAVREAKTSVHNATELSLPQSYGQFAVVPILSHQRKRCREVNACVFEQCPAWGNLDERCWLIEGTLCRSPQSVAGKEKIYGCLHCEAFPVIGVLIAGIDKITSTNLHSLEILSSEIASAVENQRLVESKREDINNLVRLHDLSVEKIQLLDKSELIKSIVDSSLIFGNTDASVLWLKSDDGGLIYAESANVDTSLIPQRLPIEDSFIGRAIIEDRPIETLNPQEAGCLTELIKKYNFLYTCTIPLRFKEEVYGCLSMFRKRDFMMTDSEKALIQLFISQSASALNIADMHGRLKEEKEFSDAIFNNMSMGIMVVDSDGVIIKINPAGIDILKSNNSIVGRRLLDVLPEAGDFLVLESELGREAELIINGTSVPIGFNNSPLFDIEGRQKGIVVAFRDLTEIRRLQAELRKKEHYEAMGKVIAGVAHEIRNPLFGISSIMQILEKDIKEPQSQALIKAVFKETQRMKNLIEELLLYSKPSKLNLSDIELDAFALRLEQYILAKNEKVLYEINAPRNLIIRADQDKLMQVFLNLIDNSINAGASRITISALKDEVKKRATIFIEDDGLGIKKENLSRIFEPFFTTRKEGTGLGLSICRKLIEDHGGSIEVESVENQGTTMKIDFPLEA